MHDSAVSMLLQNKKTYAGICLKVVGSLGYRDSLPPMEETPSPGGAEEGWHVVEEEPWQVEEVPWQASEV